MPSATRRSTSAAATGCGQSSWTSESEAELAVAENDEGNEHKLCRHIIPLVPCARRTFTGRRRREFSRVGREKRQADVEPSEQVLAITLYLNSR